MAERERESERRHRLVSFLESVFFFLLSVDDSKRLVRFPQNDMEPVPPSSAVSAANEALQRNDADYFSSLSQSDIEKICKSADEDGR